MAQKYFELDEYWTNILNGVESQLSGRGMEELFIIAEAQISDSVTDASDMELDEATNFLVATYLIWSKSRNAEKIDLNALTTLSHSLSQGVVCANDRYAHALNDAALVD